jgi:hypothetical protein
VIVDWRPMCRSDGGGGLADMNIYEISPAATTFLAEQSGRLVDHDWNPWSC